MKTPDFDQFLKVLRRSGRPGHIPFYEHIASPGFVERRLGRSLRGLKAKDYWQGYVDFWIGMGFDCVPIEILPNLPLPPAEHGIGGHASDAQVVIRNREDFERYAWPAADKLCAFEGFEIAGQCLPEGAKLVAGVAAGPFEWASYMLGVMGMSYLLLDDPELVGMVFKRIGEIHVAINRKLAPLPRAGRFGISHCFPLCSPGADRGQHFQLLRSSATEASRKRRNVRGKTVG